MTEPTICVECKCHIDMGGASHLCLASPVPIIQSFVTGDGHACTEDGMLAGMYSPNPDIPIIWLYRCRSINTSGNCPKFEKKDD